MTYILTVYILRTKFQKKETPETYSRVTEDRRYQRVLFSRQLEVIQRRHVLLSEQRTTKV